MNDAAVWEWVCVWCLSTDPSHLWPVIRAALRRKIICHLYCHTDHTSLTFLTFCLSSNCFFFLLIFSCFAFLLYIFSLYSPTFSFSLFCLPERLSPTPKSVCHFLSPCSVIQDVDSSSLEANYQSFASLMEQRLAELFLVAGRQGSRSMRSRRATSVGGYTVQVSRDWSFFL